MENFTVTAVEGNTNYTFTVTWYSFHWAFEWIKEPPSNEVTTAEYLQMCKREAQLLVQAEIYKWAQPVPIVV